MRKLTIMVGSLVGVLVVVACDEPAAWTQAPPAAAVTAQACVDCVPVSRAAVEWFGAHENLSVQDVVLELTKSGRNTPQGVRTVSLAELRELASEAGMQQGLEDEVLDCNDDRILVDRPRCEMRRGKVLITLSAPVFHGANASMRLQRWGPGPGGHWWLARYKLKLEQSGGVWRVVGTELLNQS